MALRPPVILAPLLLEDDNRTCPSLIDDLCGDLRALDHGLTDLDSLVAVDESHVAQFDCTAHIAGKAFDLKEGAVSTRYCLPPVSTIAYMNTASVTERRYVSQ